MRSLGVNTPIAISPSGNAATMATRRGIPITPVAGTSSTETAMKTAARATIRSTRRKSYDTG